MVDGDVRLMQWNRREAIAKEWNWPLACCCVWMLILADADVDVGLSCLHVKSPAAKVASVRACDYGLMHLTSLSPLPSSVNILLSSNMHHLVAYCYLVTFFSSCNMFFNIVTRFVV